MGVRNQKRRKFNGRGEMFSRYLIKVIHMYSMDPKALVRT
jgi:hypothetical protein